MKGIVLAILAVLFLSIGGGCGNQVAEQACAQLCNNKGGSPGSTSNAPEHTCVCYFDQPKAHPRGAVDSLSGQSVLRRS